MGRLDGKVAIVTGAATGIGEAIARCFAAEGAAVTIDHMEFQTDLAQRVAHEIESAGGKAQAVVGNVTDPTQIQHLIEATAQTYGGLDIFVNNAGIEIEKSFLDYTLDEWNRVISVDLTGPWLCIQAAARQMIDGGKGGRIINISSIHEDLPMPNNAPYCAAKGGLRMLTRTLCNELAPHKITINNIGPGAISTPLDHKIESDKHLLDKLLAEIPLDRMGQPKEVAELALYLASDAAAYVTGTTYFIDGGMMQQAGGL